MHICDEKTGGLLILGMGNPILGDDAAGLHALAKAQDALDTLPENASITFKPADSSGLDLISEIEGYDAMIVVDACCRTDTEPGRVKCVTRSDIDAHKASGHFAHLPSTLELGRWLGYRTPDLLGVVAIEVPEDSMEFGFQLSPEVAEAIPHASDMICTLARNFLD